MRGAHAVAEMGIASLTHQVAIRAATAVVRHASTVIPSGGGRRTTTTNASGPSQSPTRSRSPRESCGGSLSGDITAVVCGGEAPPGPGAPDGVTYGLRTPSRVNSGLFTTNFVAFVPSMVKVTVNSGIPSGWKTLSPW